MKRKNYICSILLCLSAAVIFSGCATARNYNFTLNNTLSVFLLNNENGGFFCVPVQYIGDYHIGSFEFSGGFVTIGDYEILLKRDELNISVYLNEAADEAGRSDGVFNLIYLEKNGEVSVSRMGEPLAAKQESDELMNHYYIFIEKYLKDDDLKKIINEYEKGNVYSKFGIEYDIVIDNEPQFGSGMYDDFELFDGSAMDSAWFPPNLDFFKAKYSLN